MLAKHNDVIHSELASVCAADCDEDASVARVEIHARNHEVVACITIHRVHGIAGIVEASPELTLKARLVPKRRVSRIVEVYDLVTDKNSRRTGYGMLLANVNKLAERPGAIWQGSSFGLYEQIGSACRQQDARVGCVLRNDDGIEPTTCLRQFVA